MSEILRGARLKRASPQGLRAVLGVTPFAAATATTVQAFSGRRTMLLHRFAYELRTGFSAISGYLARGRMAGGCACGYNNKIT
jgi:hypothetical protein